MGKKWSEKEIELLKNSMEYTYEERLTLFPNRSRSSIVTKMYELKLYSKNIKFSKKALLKNQNRFKSIVIDNIDNSHLIINSPEFAYLLGLLWGDGSIYNSKYEGRNKYVYIGINESDFEYVRHLFDNDWIIKTRTRTNRTNSITEAKNHNVNFSSFLFKNKYHEKSIKSPTDILTNIPENLKHYFWRGYSDADGCFYVSKNEKTFQYALAGSYEQNWKDFEDLLKSLDIKYTVKRSELKKSKYSVVRFCSKTDFLNFGKYIYQGKFFGFDRKYEKFIKAMPNVHEYPNI